MIRGNLKCFIKIKLKIFLTLDKIGITMLYLSLIRIQYSYILVTEILFHEPRFCFFGLFLYMGMIGRKLLAN